MKAKVLLICLVTLVVSWSCYSQRTNSNFGLRNKMGITLNQERSSGSFNGFDLEQYNSNLQVFLPLMIKVDTTSEKTKVSLIKAQYIFRYTQNNLSDFVGEQPLPSELYSNSLAISYTQTVGYPLFIDLSVRGSFAGDYDGYNPLHLSARGILFYNFSKQLKIGAGVLYLQTGGDLDQYIFIPYLDWRINDKWFIDMTSPIRFLAGRNLGKKNVTQLALGTYLEFVTRYALSNVEVDQIYNNVDISVGLDFRTQLHNKLYFNAFVGNNIYKEVNFRNEDVDVITKSNLGLNVKVGLSLNLE